jgi:hypothetical protein
MRYLIWTHAALLTACVHTANDNPTIQPLVDFVGGALYIGAEVLMFLP